MNLKTTLYHIQAILENFCTEERKKDGSTIHDILGNAG